MNNIYEPLFTSWKIGNCEIKNRIVLAPLGGTSIFGWMEPTHFDKEAAKYLLEKAHNNVGLIFPGIAPVKNPFMGGWLYSDKRVFKKLKVFMDELHLTGAKMFIQLTAGFGRSFAINDLMVKAAKNKAFNVLLKPIFNVDYLCAAPSATPNRWDDEITSKQLTEKQILKIIRAFGKVAKLCQEAGVDGVEIHAVHEGYLLDQFTMKYTNLRKDKWGGSFENRYRFPVEIVKAIKAKCGKDYPVSLRYSVISKTKGFGRGALPGEKNYLEVGRDMVESEMAAKYLQDAGYDMLSCDNGTYDAWYWAHPPGYMPLNCNLADASHIKKHVDIPVVCAGRMEPIVAAGAIKEGKIDAVAIGRQFLADPKWVTKLKNGHEEDIRPCICCQNACLTMCHYKGVGNKQDISDAIHMARCAINPETMQTKKYHITPSKICKNIAVVGGGIGGMETAIVLAKRGHNVTIFEKSDQLGGVFVAASNMSFKEKDRALLEWYKREIQKYSSQIYVQFNTTIRCQDCLKKQGSFDEIVIATGSTRKTLTINGFDKTIDAVDYLSKNIDVGKNPLVIGGGLTGCEIAYDLCLKGIKPIIIEINNDLMATKGICMANSTYLRDYFALHKIPVHLNSFVKEVLGDGVIVSTNDGNETYVKCSGVISSIGYTPAPILNKKTPHVYYVGDCHQVGNLRTVIWRAWDVAMKL